MITTESALARLRAFCAATDLPDAAPIPVPIHTPPPAFPRNAAIARACSQVLDAADTPGYDRIMAISAPLVALDNVYQPVMRPHFLCLAPYGNGEACAPMPLSDAEEVVGPHGARKLAHSALGLVEDPWISGVAHDAAANLPAPFETTLPDLVLYLLADTLAIVPNNAARALHAHACRSGVHAPRLDAAYFARLIHLVDLSEASSGHERVRRRKTLGPVLDFLTWQLDLWDEALGTRTPRARFIPGAFHDAGA
mgnify:CR=1 FL=1